jgi:DNA-binding PadR family transcriptional regulator
MRQNKTRYAILGMLCRGEMSGYDIKKGLDMGMRTFWNESKGQIYPILKELSDFGLAEARIERTGGKPDRHVFSITDSGREELRAWLRVPAEIPKFRLEFLLKLIFGHEASVETNLAHLQALREQQRLQMEEFLSIERHLKEIGEDDPCASYGLLTLRCGMRVTQAFLDWADEEIAGLTKQASVPARRDDK